MQFKHPLRAGLLSLVAASYIMTPGLSRADTQLIGITITGVGLYSGATGAQAAYVKFVPAMPGIEGCTYAPGDQIWIDFSSAAQPDGKTLYETVLKVFMSGGGHPLTFGLRGCADGGQVPLVYRVDLQ
jgi:hypothetical protein